MGDKATDDDFIREISRNALINVLENHPKTSEIEELDLFISKLGSQNLTHCLKFLKKDSERLQKLKPITINRIICNTNIMLDLVSPPVTTSGAQCRGQN